MSIYAVAHIVHLYCAIAFVGGVFFEVLVCPSCIRDGCRARRGAKWKRQCLTAPSG